VAGSTTIFDTVGAAPTPASSSTVFDVVGASPMPSSSTTIFDTVGVTPTPALGPGSDGTLEAVISPLGPGVDANANFISGTSLGPGVDAEANYNAIVNHGAPTGGVVPAPDPVRGFSAPTGDRFQLGTPLYVYGGPTEGATQVGPTNVFGGPTYGQVIFAGVPPAANLVATPVNVGKIALTWTDVSDRETGFRIERSLNGQGAWSTIGSVGEDVTIFIDNNATPLVVYDYRVIAFNSVDEAQPSNIASAYSPAPGQPPPPPSSGPIPPRVLEFLSPGVYGLERDADGNVGGAKS
jgi:hypothetical protein